jgi:hypothetical protein
MYVPANSPNGASAKHIRVDGHAKEINGSGRKANANEQIEKILRRESRRKIRDELRKMSWI